MKETGEHGILSCPTPKGYELIASMIPARARVLDLGCGDGTLLAMLVAKNQVIARGIEIDEENIVACLEKGLSVYHGDVDQGLSDYPDQSYDYVIVNQALQMFRRPDRVLKEILRVGKYAIVGFPNFAHWRIRLQLLLQGRMPKTHVLPHEWYATPNIHLFTIVDFKLLCQELGIDLTQEYYLIDKQWQSLPLWAPAANWIATQTILAITQAAH